MLNNKDTILRYLKQLGLKGDEAKLYLELLKGPASHLNLSRATGINRTKVYRLADDLEKHSLITTRTDDRGTFLVAADPDTLEIEVVNKEERAKNQRLILNQLLPTLEYVKNQGQLNPLNFVVHTYEGVEGFKQMLWHELKTKGQLLLFGNGYLEDLIRSKRWAVKHRAMTVQAGYKVREIFNLAKDGFNKASNFSANIHQKKSIPANVLGIVHQTAIYNNTVATYYWRHDQKVGFEVVNADYAQMMRQIFEHYWELADKDMS